MKIDTYFTVDEVDPSSLAGATVVVIDVLRATTTIVEALANGAKGIFPTESIEEAVKLAHSLGRDDTLLCGERKGDRIEGFDLGNSPSEFTRGAVGGKRLVMSTSNGTRAFSVCEHGARVLACAFTNLGAVAKAAVPADDVVLICAGRAHHFSIEDALCAGHLIRRMVGDGGVRPGLNDAGLAARVFAGSMKPTTRFLMRTEGGRALVGIGFGHDLEICADVDRHDIVAEMRDQAITLAVS